MNVQIMLHISKRIGSYQSWTGAIDQEKGLIMIMSAYQIMNRNSNQPQFLVSRHQENQTIVKMMGEMKREVGSIYSVWKWIGWRKLEDIALRLFASRKNRRAR